MEGRRIKQDTLPQYWETDPQSDWDWNRNRHSNPIPFLPRWEIRWRRRTTPAARTSARRSPTSKAQSARRADAQARARALALASSLITSQAPPAANRHYEDAHEEAEEVEHTVTDVTAAASKLRGSDARRWLARQIMLPEWMVDAPPHLSRDWSVTPSPSKLPVQMQFDLFDPLLFCCPRLISFSGTLPYHLTI
jgi:hypothetical protein